MIKNECSHAYKLLDHAEFLWCENCVEKLAERLNKKPKVTEEFVDKWYSTIMELASGDYPELGSDDLEEMLKEAGVGVA